MGGNPNSISLWEIPPFVCLRRALQRGRLSRVLIDTDRHAGPRKALSEALGEALVWFETLEPELNLGLRTAQVPIVVKSAPAVPETRTAKTAQPPEAVPEIAEAEPPGVGHFAEIAAGLPESPSESQNGGSRLTGTVKQRQELPLADRLRSVVGNYSGPIIRRWATTPRSPAMRALTRPQDVTAVPPTFAQAASGAVQPLDRRRTGALISTVV